MDAPWSKLESIVTTVRSNNKPFFGKKQRVAIDYNIPPFVYRSSRMKITEISLKS